MHVTITKIKLALLAILFAFVAKAQTPTSCSLAASYSYPINQTVSSYVDSYYWFQVTLGVGNYNIGVKSASSTNKISRADVYTGSCTGLSLYGTDSLFRSSDSSFFISITNTVSTSYYIRLNNTGTTTFSVTTSTFCSIVGDIGFCPSISSITLAANILSPGGGAQTYTWQPGGANTSSISISSPSPNTYTLTYKDGGGTYTTSITTFTLGSSACNNCELTQNGAFEAYQYQSNIPSNIFCNSPSSSALIYSNPKVWTGPTVGSPDYYNANYPFSSGVSVPNGTIVPSNDFTSYNQNGQGHSGKGYAGLFAYNPNLTPEFKEYLQEPLKCALISGQAYNVNFYAALTSSSLYTTNSLGAYLSTAAITSTSYTNLAVTPQITAVSPIITYTTWTNISGIYNATGGEQYVTIGNFQSDINTPLTMAPNPYSGYPYIYLFIDDISITPATPTLTASNYTVACNTHVSQTLTAVGCANLYTSWTDGVNTYTGSTVYVPSPQVSTTYTCTVNLSSVCPTCLPLTQTITINVIGNPTISIVASPTTICFGSSSTLTPSGASSYTWTASPTLSCTTCTVTIASPTVSTTYSVTGSYTTGCSSSATVAVTVQTNSCSGGTPTSYSVSSGSLTANPAFIASSFTVAAGGTYTINSANVEIAPNVSITVQPNATLTINDSWLHACASCGGSMWSGIYVQNGGVLVINSASSNYSIIEDAVSAVNTASNTVSTPVPLIKISNTIFNKNTKDIYGDAHSGDFSGSYVYNNIFTCRSLSSTSVTATNYSSIKTDITNATPIHTSTVNPTTTTLAGARTTHGIYLNTLAGITTTVSIGSSTQGINLFDNLDFGIYAYRTNLVVKNNRFQNLTGYNFKSIVKGVGIYAVELSGEGVHKLVVGNNTTTIVSGESNSFLSCLRGIWTDSYNKGLFINNNTFDCETTASAFATAPATGQYGVINTSFGSGGTLSQPEVLQFANNTCNNYYTGFYHDFLKVNNTTSATSYWGSNTISSYTTTTSATNYCKYGIYLSTGNGSVVNSSVPQDAMKIESNTINHITWNAIFLNNVGSATTTGYLTVSQNTELGVKYNSGYTTLQNPPIAAVFLTGCSYVKVSDNTNIKSDHSPYTSGDAQYTHGVYAKQSPSCLINCNTVNYVGEDFVWEGTCTGSKWVENKMQNSRYGLVLRSSGSMGDQGSPSNPIYNTWGKSTTSITDKHTLADASDPSTIPTSKLYCLAATCLGSTTPLPCTNGGSGVPYSSSTLSVTTGSSPNICASDCGTGCRTMATGNQTYSDSTTVDSTLTAMVDGIENGAPLPVYDDETRWAVQYYVSGLDTTIDAATNYTNAKTMAIADAAAGNADYATAQSINNSIVPNNTIETNWQQVNNIWLRKVSDTTYQYTSADSSTLESIAAQCPLSGGSIVYKARAIVNAYYQTIMEYPNACSSNGGISDKTSGITNVSLDKNRINLYPNPNNGSMNISYSIKQNASLEITDISGKLVGTYNMEASDNNIKIKNDNLQAGVYLYRVISNGANLKTGKFIIIK